MNLVGDFDGVSTYLVIGVLGSAPAGTVHGERQPIPCLVAVGVPPSKVPLPVSALALLSNMWASDANLRPAKLAFSQAYSAPGPDADFADQDVPAAFDEEYEGNSDLAIDDERKAGAHAGDVNIDLVVFAQSFHWVHPDNALESLASILRPHGRLALLELGQAHAGSAVDQAAARPGTTPLLTDAWVQMVFTYYKACLSGELVARTLLTKYVAQQHIQGGRRSAMHKASLQLPPRQLPSPTIRSQ